MKMLFTAGGGQAIVFAVAPLASAARNAGHEILLAADEPLMEVAEAIGLPAVRIIPERMRYGRDVRPSGRRAAPTCDLAVHHGGATTVATMINAGVPQLIIPDMGMSRSIAESLHGFGAALVVDGPGPSRPGPGRALRQSFQRR